MDVFVLTNQTPDWTSQTGSPKSIHRTLDGAKKAAFDGKYTGEWTTTNGIRWIGPDGFGSIIKMEVKD